MTRADVDAERLRQLVPIARQLREHFDELVDRFLPPTFQPDQEDTARQYLMGYALIYETYVRRSQAHLLAEFGFKALADGYQPGEFAPGRGFLREADVRSESDLPEDFFNVLSVLRLYVPLSCWLDQAIGLVLSTRISFVQAATALREHLATQLPSHLASAHFLHVLGRWGPEEALYITAANSYLRLKVFPPTRGALQGNNLLDELPGAVACALSRAC
jgi:hypothetical protein